MGWDPRQARSLRVSRVSGRLRRVDRAGRPFQATFQFLGADPADPAAGGRIPHPPFPRPGAPRARTPQEVFQHHAEALGAGDLDGIVEDYADHAVFITPADVSPGTDGIRAAFTQSLANVPDAAGDLMTQIYVDDVLFLERAAEAAAAFVEDGIDIFVFRDGLIRMQTVRYTLQRKV